jgi:hypothetical protein
MVELAVEEVYGLLGPGPTFPVTITGKAHDLDGIKSVKWRIGETGPFELAQNESGDWGRWSAKVTLPEEASYQIVVRAFPDYFAPPTEIYHPVETKKVTDGPWDDRPVLLLPLRLETRFLGNDLWVRIYPDQIFVDAHDPRLTPAEREAGEMVRDASSDEDKRSAWRELARRFGPERAAWIAWVTRTITPEPIIKTEDEAWLTIPKLVGLPDRFVVFAYPNGGEDDPITATGNPIPRDLTLLAAPYRVTYEETEPATPGVLRGKVVDSRSNPIYNVALALEGTDQRVITENEKGAEFRFTGLSEREVTLRVGVPRHGTWSLTVDAEAGMVTILVQDELFDDKSRWMVDHDQAEKDGMAVRVPLSSLTKDERKNGFSRVVVVGLRWSSAAAGQGLLENLIDCHRYASGLSFLKYGTPTNNTRTTRSGHSETTEDLEGSYETEILGPPGWDDQRANAQRLGRALGLVPEENGDDPDKILLSETLRNLGRAGEVADSYAQEMQTALWPATGDYFLRSLLPGVMSEEDLEKLCQHFVKSVRGSGPLPAIRVGDQPYAILPVTNVPKISGSWRGWEASPLDNSGSDECTAFDARLHSILIRLYERWLTWAANRDCVPRIDEETTDPDRDLVRVLAMEPMSLSYCVRPFVEKDFVQFLLDGVADYVFKPGSEYAPANVSPRYWVEEWAGVWQKEIQESAKELLKSLAGESVAELEGAPLLSLHGWWDERDLPLDLVRHYEEGDQGALVETEGPLQYLRSLRDNEVFDPEPATLLCDLLQLSLSQADSSCFDKSKVRDAIRRLAFAALLDFLNEVSQPEQLVPRIVDDRATAGSVPYTFGIRRPLALRVLEVGDSLRKGGYTSIDQIDDMFDEDDYLADLLNYFRDRRPALDVDRLFRQTLDVCTHRLDAWVTSLAWKRLKAMRRDKPDGILLGAYGYVENLKPGYATDSSGYIHAPSQGQAAAAAVLHNAYLTHADGNKPNPFRINLNSERVRRALFILEGMRQGQPLGALLGYQFERALHERRLDEHIDEFRQAFPIVTGTEAGSSGTGSLEAVAARNVVDGLALARWDLAKKAGDLGDEDLKLPDQKTLDDLEELLRGDEELRIEVALLQNNLDAVNDLLMYEGIYQAVQGNAERSGAVLEAAAGNAYPPEIESVSTPISGRLVGHRVCLLFPPPASGEAAPDPRTDPRGAAEPRLAAWFSDLLGDLSQIRGRYTLPSSSQAGTISLGDLGISAIDLLYLSTSPPGGGETEIEQRLKYWVRGEWVLSPEVEVKLDLSRQDGYAFGIGEALELARQIQNTLAAGSPLHPRSLCPPDQADDTSFTSGDDNEPGDVGELGARVAQAHSALVGLQGRLGAGENDALLEVGRYGISGAIPPGPNNPDLESRRQNVLGEIEKRLKKCQGLQGEAASLDDPDRQVGLLVEAMQALFGRGFVALPTFVPPNAQELARAFAQEGLLARQGDERVRLWLQQLARVHAPLRELEDTLMMTEAWLQSLAAGVEPALRLQVGQLPFDPQNEWLALGDDERSDGYDTWRDRGALSVVAVSQDTLDFSQSPRVAGLLLDEWDERIPDDSLQTSVAFQYDGPNSQAPQSLLLAVPGRREALQAWTAPQLAEIVKDTMDLAKVRAVDLDAMWRVEGEDLDGRGVGLMLPDLLIQTNPNDPDEWARETAFDIMADWLSQLLPLKCAGFEKDDKLEDGKVVIGEPGAEITIDQLGEYVRLWPRDSSSEAMQLERADSDKLPFRIELPVASRVVRLKGWSLTPNDLTLALIDIKAFDRNPDDPNAVEVEHKVTYEYREEVEAVPSHCEMYVWGANIKALQLTQDPDGLVLILWQVCYAAEA